MKSPTIPERVNILGVGINAINMDMAVEIIDRWIGERKQQFVCCTDVHGVVRSQHDRDFREVLSRAGLVTPDGMPLVWISRLKNFRHVGRVYGPDLMSEVCAISPERKYRHYLYGGAEDVPEKLAGCLRRRYPGIDVVGTYSPPFRPLTSEEDEAVVRRINDSKADIVWVGIGSPKQEHWMSAHLGLVDAPVMIGVGAAFDFL
ncbi:MAG: WecB/TagA/CpsF family glycosyltransferase, partial [Xanthomonadales bacterium]|nr:WecB/TagA/CpsF family glycosyltransferase [Xanthomonadales bacterium]